MRSGIVCLMAAVLAFSAGCNKKSTSGGPGASGTSSRILGQAEATFSLDVPNLATKLKQGESKAFSISLKRGKNFDEDVTLKFGDLPKGVTIEPATPAIKHGEEEAKLMLKAADDAALGDFTVKVTGEPSKGAVASNEFKVTVDKK